MLNHFCPEVTSLKLEARPLKSEAKDRSANSSQAQVDAAGLIRPNQAQPGPTRPNQAQPGPTRPNISPLISAWSEKHQENQRELLVCLFEEQEAKMSERKVLNKYYPPDYDPSKIPKLKLPKDQQYVVRLMAPFNMRCKTCGEYIYKGKKFNARKETVQNEAYQGLPIFRFYIKCTRCLAEITFKTDPENTNYTMEHGATRNFQAEKLLQEEEKRVQKEREDEELNNPMKVLENRTKDSKLEMEVLENLRELKDLNQRQAHVDFKAMLLQHCLSQKQRQQQEEEERETAALLEEARRCRLLEDSNSEDKDPPSRPLAASRLNPTAILDEVPKAKRKAEGLSSRAQLAALVVPKKVKMEANGGSEQVQVPAMGAPESRKAADPTPQTPGASSLSQLGAYGDSKDSDS